ncbi:glutamate receptor ionotropic, kainate 2-like isoform X1 [Portunus trituberculatus]|uniref:glutamate receptor ionotropic, kainate 2-like isoform X1 n=1 Tax=Portunus trituberculatus TaxID=210409 RepID=UPI001E1D0B03|nr:glutamate receptor ionotropic, kainate 2-like isoform X1 [Portunus trituberculatus]
MKIAVVTVVLVALTCWRAGNVGALPSIINIGAILDKDGDMQELAMRYAVERVNADPKMLPRSTLQTHIDRQPADDSFQASKRVCHLLSKGMAAIFGPQSENTANHVQSICDNKEIPHIETRYDYKLTRDEYSINLHPYPPALSQAYYDILKELKWKSFVVLYDSNESLVRLQKLLQDSSWKVHIRQLVPNTDHRPLLKQIRWSIETRILIDVREDMIYEVLKQAGQVGLMTQYYSYFITSLDFNQMDLHEFRHGDTNITGIQLVDPNSKDVKDLVEKWKLGERLKGRSLPQDNRITTGAALMFDAVILFASALTTMDKSGQVSIRELNCSGDRTWQHGNSLINYMKWYGSRAIGANTRDTHRQPYRGVRYNPFDPRQNLNPLSGMSYYNMTEQVRVVGLTGVLRFDDAGFRSDFNLDIIEMDINNRANPLKTVGKWTPKEGANFTRMWSTDTEDDNGILKNRTLIVSTALTPPYTMLRKSSDQLTGNDRFEGFCIDIIKEISRQHGFNYSIEISPDGAYGSKNPITQEWNGIVRELIDHRADLGIVDFTITYEREEAVDFTMPFMNLGISIIYSKPQKKSPSLFSFMSPFSVDVWIYMATAYLGVSVLLFILARVAPQEWDNPHPCIQDPEELENSISLSNAFWFTIGSVMQQGSDIAPKAVSTRIVAGIWWFFTLIMISSYTANLAAFLTVERMDAPIESAEDLAKQTKIKYGCKKDGSTYKFFMDSNIPTYMKMWTTMSNARPSVFTTSNDEGVERAAKSKGMYAFLMESSSIEYVVERNCDLMQIGGLLDSKSYGIALPPGSPYTAKISSAILRMKENGTLHRLKDKWWKGEGLCMNEASSAKSSGAAELGLANVGGVFVVLIGGMAVAALMAMCEFMWNARDLATDESASFCEELSSEVKFIMKCSGNTKPVRKRAPPTPEEPLFTYGSYAPNYGYSERK